MSCLNYFNVHKKNLLIIGAGGALGNTNFNLDVKPESVTISNDLLKDCFTKRTV